MKRIALFSLLAAILLTASCAKQEPGAFPAETARAFSDAGLSLFNTKIAPRDFALPELSRAGVPEALAKKVSLAQLKGKLVFLNFWATWCGPCRAEMPSMEALYVKYREQGLEILAVNSGEGRAEVEAFIQENGFTFPVLLDGDGTVSGAYGVQAIPTSYLIDSDGMIILRMVGSIDWNTPEMHAALELLLE